MKSAFIYLIKLIFFLNYNNFCITSCPKEKPFLQNDSCVETCNNYLTDCYLNNEIIKTQYLNNIISIPSEDFLFINIVTTEKGDLLYLSSCYPADNNRILFGLNKDGNGYFKSKTNNYARFINLTTGDNFVGRFESEIYPIKLSNSDSNIEYL